MILITRISLELRKWTENVSWNCRLFFSRITTGKRRLADVSTICRCVVVRVRPLLSRRLTKDSSQRHSVSLTKATEDHILTAFARGLHWCARAPVRWFSEPFTRWRHSRGPCPLPRYCVLVVSVHNFQHLT